MFVEMFVVGTFWFWALCLAEFIFLIILLERERYYEAPVSLVFTLSLIAFFGSGIGDALRWIIQNPAYTMLGILGYFTFGVLYTSTPWLGKWWWFVRDVRDHNRDHKREWLDGYQAKIAAVNSSINRLRVDIQELATKPNTEWQINKINETNAEIAKLSEFITALSACNGEMTEDLLPFWKEEEKTYSFYDLFGRQVKITKPEPGKFKARIISWIVYWPPSLVWTLLNDPLRRIGRRLYDLVASLLKAISDSAWKDEDKI